MCSQRKLKYSHSNNQIDLPCRQELVGVSFWSFVFLQLSGTVSETFFEFALGFAEVASNFWKTRSTEKYYDKQDDDPDFRAVEHTPTIASPPENALSNIGA